MTDAGGAGPSTGSGSGPTFRHARPVHDPSFSDAPTLVPRSLPPAADEPVPVHVRYEPRSILGAGGEGVVYLVHDRELERLVALKTLRLRRMSPDGAVSFVEEARSAASLEHPNVVPIHDVGYLDDGRPFYTMRLVEGRSLSAVLRELAETQCSGEPAEEWSIVRLVQVVQQACRALQLAHERGILHRDVKPSNILLGTHGEVLLVDWGIAKGPERGGHATATGIVKGTVAYMSPEQACAERIDHRADIYSLGVVLYQCLALRLPFARPTDAEVIAAILRDDAPPPASVAPARAIPEELSTLALRALSKNPELRPQSAMAFDEELQSYVEGLRDRERRRQRAAALCVRGDEALARNWEVEDEVERLRAEVARLEATHAPWEPISEKADLLDARRRLAAAEEQVEATFLEAVDAFADSLAHLPDHAPARQAMADMYWKRFVAAERAGDTTLARTCQAVVERYHDGRLAKELRGDGLLDLVVTPPDAELTLHPLVEQDLVLVDGPGRPLGSGKVSVPLPMGSYVVVATAPGHESARYPVCIERNTHWKGELKLLPEGTLLPGFVYVPGTDVWLGGDPKATNGWPLRRVHVESFAMARHPVTFGEYCEFLDALAAESPGSELPHVPSLEEGFMLCLQGPEGSYGPAAWAESFNAFNGSVPEDPRHAPAFGISSEDAAAHARWMSRSLGRVVRLPEAEEWELAARGVDRRVHPWGNTFDPALCLMRDSRPDMPLVRQVGDRPADRSVYHVQDLAGCIQELTTSRFDASKRLIEVRGGSWSTGPPATRSAWRGACTDNVRNMQLGYRLVLEL